MPRAASSTTPSRPLRRASPVRSTWPARPATMASAWRCSLRPRSMREHVALITGHLARDRLERAMEAIGRETFDWTVIDGGVKVAALLTEAILRRRIALP